MNKTLIAAAIGVTLAASGNAFAASTEDRLAALEKRLAYLEQHIAAQNKVIAEKDKQLSELKGASAESGSWFKSVEIGGVVEVEVGHSDNGNASDTTDVTVPTAKLGIAAQVNDWVAAELVALYEDDGTHSGQFDVDTAMVSIADPDNIWFVNAGQYTLPFGVYASNMVSDPLTLEIGKTRDAAIGVGLAQDGMSGSFFVFNGDQPHNDGAAWGATAGYQGESEGVGYHAQVGYMNDLSESDGIVDQGTPMTTEAAAWTASLGLTIGDIMLIGEYLAATETLTGYGEQPSVYNIEAGYGFDMGGLPAIAAIGYQGSSDAAATGLPETRYIGALSVEVMEGTSLAVEYARDKPYTGVDNNSITGQVAVEF